MMMGGVGGQTLRVRSARWNHQSAPHTATRRTRPRAHAALLGLDLETVVALALPASGAVALAYWLADQQDVIKPGDAMTLVERDVPADAESQVSLFDNSDVFSLGVPIRLTVGSVKEPEKRIFYVRPLAEGKLVTVTVERPAGVLFDPAHAPTDEARGGAGERVAEQDANGVVRVAAVAADSNAARQARLAQLIQEGEAFQVGDRLRAFVTTTTVYSGGALAGATLPTRTLQCVDVDELRGDWEMLAQRLARGRRADGLAQFVLEREQSNAAAEL